MRWPPVSPLQEDLLESIRMLQDQMQLKDMVIEAFIPPEEVQKVRCGDKLRIKQDAACARLPYHA